MQVAKVALRWAEVRAGWKDLMMGEIGGKNNHLLIN